MTAEAARTGTARARTSSAGSPATAFRATLLVLCSALSAFSSERTYAAVPVALLAAFALAADRVPVIRRHPVVAAVAEAAGTGIAVALTGGATSPMLPYLLAPGLAIGLAGTWRQVCLVTASAVAGLGVGRVLHELGADAVPDQPLADFAADTALWVLLGLAFGLVAGWAQRLTVPPTVPSAERYAEARELLEQLRRVTRRLPGGLDLTSSAEGLLERCSQVVTSARSAVLVQPAPGVLVPAAVRGTARVPWRAPLTEPGPLQRAWDSGAPVVDTRKPDVRGRRRGSALAVLPLSTDEGPFGLLILETFEESAFTPECLAELEGLAAEAALRLETAMLFDEVRSTVMVDERDRLAREMHDGVAQELAFVGYQLDDLRMQAAKVDDALADRMSDVRKGLTRLISDIRLSITDLKTSVGNDRGLGAAISSYVRAVGSGSKVTVHVSLQESSFRLPGETEVLLFQITQAVAQDVRKSGHAENLWVTLRVDPPSARLRVEHDGSGDPGDLDMSAYSENLGRIGGTLRITRRSQGGLCVEAVLDGGGAA